ncbi:MAG: 3,4-dihydroxy 2-butanone 4-phosphate synthase/GTP cyclohydrolase II [Verrucomicrobiales bacterium]|jgi:3,4-dihydroxy 2-butanone 4-phosphate synthase/GTP cyclohydrolase II
MSEPMPETSESEPQLELSPIEDVIADIQAGKIVIVIDDEDRENEGDLIAASELITPESVNFMLRHARGMLCVAVGDEIADRLQLPAMVANNREAYTTDFRVTVDAAEGITTGISAADRAATIKLLGSADTTSNQLVRPGHIPPLRAKQGGVLRRAGHTEAAVDLASLAGLQPSGVLIEVLNEDGSMARLPELHAFAKEHDLKICTIESLIDYRRKREQMVKCIEVVKMPTDFGDFNLHMYETSIDDEVHLAMVKGEIDSSKPVLVRVHSECLTGDVFGSRRCDCGGQLHAAMQKIEDEGAGVLLYMRQEGRGIGLKGKIQAYKLQEQGFDTVEANEKLGYPMDLRDYGTGAQILYDLGIRSIRLMTNNPRKVVGLEGHNLQIVEKVAIREEPNEHNQAYLDTKRRKMGHFL